MAKSKRMPAGVKELGGGVYEIRGTWTDPGRANRREFLLQVEAGSPWEAAQRRESELERRRAGTVAAAPARERLDASLQAWIGRRSVAGVKSAWSPSTRSLNVSSAKAWLDAIPGDTYVDSVTPNQVLGAMLGWRDVPLATKTINGRLGMLRTWAKDVRAQHVVEGVAALEAREDEVPGDEDDIEGRGLLPGEVRQWLPAASSSKWWPFFALLFGTGARPGELLALQWRHVDLESGRIRIRRSVWNGIIKPPKTVAGVRDVYVVGASLDALRSYRAGLGDIEPDAVVFPGPRAAIVSDATVRDEMHRVMQKAGITLDGRPPLYCMRHTYNNLLRQVVPEAVRQATVGHADAESGKAYTMVSPEERLEAARKVHSLRQALVGAAGGSGESLSN
jgi:integrase